MTHFSWLIYAVIFFSAAFGVGFHVIQTIIDLGNQYKDKKSKEIIAIFFANDWDSLSFSGLITLFLVFVYFVVENFAPKVLEISYFNLFYFGASVIMGYAGQRLLYKWLGTAADALDKKVDGVLNK